MNNCGDCKFFDRQEFDPDIMGEPIDGEPFGYTVETGHHNPATPWGSCNKVAMMGPRQVASDKFYVRDASMYSAHLYVRDDFGCVEWEQVKR